MELFQGTGQDIRYIAAKENPNFQDIRSLCEELWVDYAPLAEDQFPQLFSENFDALFWEMYLGSLLRRTHGVDRPLKGGPDFKTKDSVWFEATVATTGHSESADSVPPIKPWPDEDDSVPFEQLSMRVTSKVEKKAKSNNIPNIGLSDPVVIAINMPYPQVWLEGTPPLASMAMLGLGGTVLVLPENEPPYSKAVPRISIAKSNGSEIDAAGFLRRDYRHVSAIIVASVNPYSSSYSLPPWELLHNPNADHPLPEGYLKRGTEYKVVEGKLVSTEHSS